MTTSARSRQYVPCTPSKDLHVSGYPLRSQLHLDQQGVAICSDRDAIGLVPADPLGAIVALPCPPGDSAPRGGCRDRDLVPSGLPVDVRLRRLRDIERRSDDCSAGAAEVDPADLPRGLHPGHPPLRLSELD